MKRLVLLGASGSIGTQTVDIIQQHPDLFELVSFGVGKNITKAKEYLSIFPNIDTFSVAKKEDAEALQKEYPNKKVLFGESGMEELVSRDDYDVLVNALVGFAGFLPTLKAIETKHNVALANKETLVCGGKLINKALKENGCELYPIDSEHSAIWQSLRGNKKDQVKRLLITCSGGAFRNKSRDELKDATVEEALAHPNWSMGAKITIDSATLMNKGFEVIEAHWLFGIPYENISVLMHPESVLHSAVEYVDHSVIGQLGAPDMRLPIQYALTYPDRYSYQLDTPLDLAKLGTLHFDKPDTERFPLLALAFKAGIKGGNLNAVMNAANEVANAAFRNHEIPFLMIEKIVIDAVHSVPYKELKTVQDVIDADTWGREYALKIVKGVQK
jgi:1-deoxy-D-xylulose-5-phosphate reductoisomerase